MIANANTIYSNKIIFDKLRCPIIQNELAQIKLLQQQKLIISPSILQTFKIPMQQQYGLQTLRTLNKNQAIEVEHDMSAEISMKLRPKPQSMLLSGKLPQEKKPGSSCGHDHGDGGHSHSHKKHSHSHDDEEHSHEDHGHKGHSHGDKGQDEHGLGKNKRHQRSGKKPKNYGIMFYTIFTCLSCLYLETQHLNPIRGDYLSRVLSYLTWFDVFMCLWSYIQTYRIGNKVPKLSKLLPVDTIGGKIVDPKYLLTRRDCEKCNYYKLPRVSHCSTCGECIYKLDHHCMWTQTCIGHCNQRPFIWFCLYMTVGVLQFWVSTVRAVSVMTGACQSHFFSVFEPGVYVLWAITCFSAGVVGLMIVGLGISHSLMVCTNATTLDSMKKKVMSPLPFIQCRPHYHKNEMINTFDRGQIQNLRSLFGTNIVTFWLPFGRQIENEFIIEPMNPQPSKLQLMKQTTLYDSEIQISNQFEKKCATIKDLYKGKKFILDGEEITV